MTPQGMRSDAIYFVPLGGVGFFGANMSLYGYRGQWIMVDCGMGFADETMPGVEILLPDPAFAASLGDDLLAIVLTHGHEDHIGAVGHLWPRLRKPLYATKFTAARLRRVIDEQTWGPDAALRDVADGGRVEIGPFMIDFIRMAHSIPEASALAIAVPAIGTVVHTGDWKLDPDPIEGDVTDGAALTKLGEAGVLAVVGDSTNAMVPGHSGSERMVEKNLTDLFGEYRDKKIALTCFSTNVARLHSVSTAAAANGRKVCLVGRSLWRIEDVSRRTGYLKDVPPFLTDEEASLSKPREIVYVCTGSQGEPRSALSRITAGEHPYVRLGAGDVMIFSSRDIPGNERTIDRLRNRLRGGGVDVITDRDAPIHVSGHPYRDELKQLYAWLKPEVAIPVHGEMMQLEKHAVLARDCGVPQSLIPENGQVIEIMKDGASVVGTVDSGILALEGGRIVAIDHEAILTRKRIMWNGSAVVTVVIDERGDLLAEPKITALGLLDENSELDAEYIRDAIKEVRNVVKNMPRDMRASDDAFAEAVRVAARKFFTVRFDRKPQTRVHLVRI